MIQNIQGNVELEKRAKEGGRQQSGEKEEESGFR